MIKIEKLFKSYDENLVLKDINIDIPTSSKYGIIGRSGTGKSTLLRCINGLEKFDSGKILVSDTNIKILNKNELREIRRDIGMIFQHFSLLNRLTVYENIALPMKCWKYDNNKIDKKVKELLEIIGLTDKINAKPRELSGGQKQRVAIGRALTLNPKVLLCDEATSALDPKTAQNTIELLNDINKSLGITLVVVTHQMSVLRSLCDEIAILEDKKIADCGDINTIFRDRPKSLQNLIGEPDILIPKTGKTFEVCFSKDNGNISLISVLARKFNIDCIVLGGDMEIIDNLQIGSIIFNVLDKDYEIVKKYLNSEKFIWKILDESR